MSNENLRDALQQAGITTDQLADQIQVDARTVRRWLAGGVPHARQRANVARALDRDQIDLWPWIAIEPDRQATTPSDLIAGYASGGQLEAPDWKDLLPDVHERIELLGNNLAPVIETRGAGDLIAAKAEQGCLVRLLLATPRPGLAALASRPGIEIRVLSAKTPLTIHRFDDQLLLEVHIFVDDVREQPPMFQLRRRATEGLFDAFARHYELLWENHARPFEPERDIPDPNDKARVPTEGAAAGTVTRRWPRRPPPSQP